MRLKTVSRHALYYAICIALAGPVFAQTDQAADAAMLDEEVLEEVIVTGSRLKRDSYTVSTPLVMMESQAIQDTGIGSLTEILVDEVARGESHVRATLPDGEAMLLRSTVGLRRHLVAAVVAHEVPGRLRGGEVDVAATLHGHRLLQ